MEELSSNRQDLHHHRPYDEDRLNLHQNDHDDRFFFHRTQDAGSFNPHRNDDEGLLAVPAELLHFICHPRTVLASLSTMTEYEPGINVAIVDVVHLRCNISNPRTRRDQGI